MKDPVQNAFWEQIRPWWPLAKGSLSEVRKPCVRPGCRSCAEGRKHPAWIFTFREKGRQRCLYVPVELVPVLRQALTHGRRLEQRLSQMGKELIQAYRRQRDQALEKIRP